MTIDRQPLAIWALTTQGAALGRRIRELFAGSRLFLGSRTEDDLAGGDAIRFERLRDALPLQFHRHGGHVFIMAAGIVVRSLAGLPRSKTTDPAVVVVDERGLHAISLLSGHLGGANDLARRIAAAIGARPVITTATDLHGVPAIDLIARERGLAIENPAAIRHVSLALLEGRPITLHDPHGWLSGALPDHCLAVAQMPAGADRHAGPGVWVDDIRIDLPAETLILRPASLFVGVGCNRNTPAREIREFLALCLDRQGLAEASIAGIASIDLKSDEAGLLALADTLARPLVFFTREALGAVTGIPSPSAVVEKHVGVKSVCEAAAILAAGGGHLIAPKQISPNVTIAIARKSSISSD